jgi:hypothetical protein
VRHLRQRYRETGQTADQKVLSTDKSRFCLTRGDREICVYRQLNERYTEACTLELY